MGGVKIFQDITKYQELVNMLRDGVPYSQIARKYGADHSSIMYHARKLGIPTNWGKPRKQEVIRKFKRVPQYKSIGDFYMEEGERINTGKNYADYLADERKRNPKLPLEEIVRRRLEKMQLTKPAPTREWQVISIDVL